MWMATVEEVVECVHLSCVINELLRKAGVQWKKEQW